MQKLRQDLVGVVYVDGQAYGAGDTLPDGAVVSEKLLEKAAAPSRRRARQED